MAGFMLLGVVEVELPSLSKLELSSVAGLFQRRRPSSLCLPLWEFVVLLPPSCIQSPFAKRPDHSVVAKVLGSRCSFRL